MDTEQPEQPTKVGTGKPPEVVPTTIDELKADAEQRVDYLQRRLDYLLEVKRTTADMIRDARAELATANRVLRSFEPHHRGPKKAKGASK